MRQREQDLKSIADAFAVWQTKLAHLGSLNLFDAHVISEHTVCELLNEVFGYKLTSANELRQNHPGIDLVDNKNSIAVQVSATARTAKVQHTIDTFVAEGLHLKYQQLLMLVLGKKQARYSALRIPPNVAFDDASNVLDFQDLLRVINVLPSSKLTRIAKIASSTFETAIVQKRPSTAATRVKRNLGLERRLQRELLRKLDRSEWEHSWYEPWIKFKYSNLIVRSVEDKSWPDVDENPPRGTSSWLKMTPWDFYENGIEFLEMGQRAILDKDNHWDLLDINDEREKREEYRIVTVHPIARIPYDNIVELDMQPDAYYGVPTLFVEYANEGAPFSEIIWGLSGVYRMRRHRHDFDPALRRRLP